MLGWSLGATVALYWARHAPAHVARLVLVCPTPRFVATDDWAHAMAADTLARFADELTVAYRLTLQRFLTLQVQGSDEGRATLAALRGALFARGEPAPARSRHSTCSPRPTCAPWSRGGRPGARRHRSRDTLTTPAAGAWLARIRRPRGGKEIEGAAHAPFLSHRRR